MRARGLAHVLEEIPWELVAEQTVWSAGTNTWSSPLLPVSEKGLGRWGEVGDSQVALKQAARTMLLVLAPSSRWENRSTSPHGWHRTMGGLKTLQACSSVAVSSRQGEKGFSMS